MRKEKLGERVTALQQLVSPFGKVQKLRLIMLIISFSKEKKTGMGGHKGNSYLNWVHMNAYR